MNDAAGTAAEARAVLERAGGFAVRNTPPEQLSHVLREELAAHPPRIVVSGGDGTIGTAAVAVLETHTELAILPGGTLNHFARDHGVPVALEEAVRCATTGTVLHADVAYANDRLFLNTSSVGAYVTFVRLRERLEHFLPYRLASIVAGIRLFFNLRSVRVELVVDGEVRRYDTPLVFIGVGERETRAPHLGSRIQHGRHLLHVLVVRERRAARLIALGIEAAARGLRRVARTPEVDAFLVAECTVGVAGPEQRIALDGELVRTGMPVRYRIVPGALPVVVPVCDGERAREIASDAGLAGS